VTNGLTWSALDDDDSFDELRALTHACLRADGGMPLFIGEQMLRGRMLIGKAIAAHDASGTLVAAASIFLNDSGAITTGMVHPTRRGEKLGSRLMQWARTQAGDVPLTVATEMLSERAERLYARFGLAEVFAEDVMRHDLADVPDVPAPEGITFTPVSAADHNLLFEAYARSFADRPGFTLPIGAEWLDELIEDPDYRADLSLLATDVDQPVGFVNVLGTWVDQVGVVPPYRGLRLGAHLVAHVLGALAGEGGDGCWLTVNVDNPAGRLYRSLGFRVVGRRARYAADLTPGQLVEPQGETMSNPPQPDSAFTP
jgi:mycothiol synthase